MTQIQRAAQAEEEAARRCPTPLAPEEIRQELSDALEVTAAARRWMVSNPSYAANALQVAALDPLLLYCWEASARIESARIEPSDARELGVVPLYELLLARRDPRHRRRSAVYGTPWPLAHFMLRSVDLALREDFGYRDGLATEGPIRFWDPAAGSGIFAAAAIRQLRDSYPVGRLLGEWPSFARDWLPRFSTDELRLAPWVLSHWVLSVALAQSHIQLHEPLRAPFRWRDALASPGILSDERTAIVVGNPPYRSLALPGHEWMDNLIRGVDADGTPRANYHAIDGEPLGERKTWLQDDYVKFLRRAHAEVERARVGMVCFVTNHGYLDNPTFRGVRRALQETFRAISVVDLHGNATRRETTPAGKPDQNIFGIETGVAIGLFSTAPRAEAAQVDSKREIFRGDVWGDRAEKEEALDAEFVQSLAANRCATYPPDYAFVGRQAVHAEYEAGISLPDLMPLASSAIVTARDRLAIAFDYNELVARLHELRDPSIPDEQIREHYLRSRSPRHSEGNTRGWDLAAARADLRGDSDWQIPISPCAYRPFDIRMIYDSPRLVDWRRTRVMRLLSPTHSNLAFIARRQMPAGQPANYFWVTDLPVVDGIIRSDNRGNESVFPLYDLDDAGEHRANFALDKVDRFAKQLGREWLPLEDGDCRTTFGPRDLAAYLYGLFWTPSYQETYAASLRTNFPRVLLPKSSHFFDRVSQLGRRLIGVHLLKEGVSMTPSGEAASIIAAGFPKYEDETIWLAPGVSYGPVKPEVWNFRVGAHQVARKWLRDRLGRTLSKRDGQTYISILVAIESTLEIQQKLEAAVVENGGPARVFQA